MTDDMDHMKYLEAILKHDLEVIHHKESTYRGSWKKRGGVGAFFVTIRKADRLENIASKFDYDIFKALLADPTGQDGSALADLRDLRQYLALIESQMMVLVERESAQVATNYPTTHWVPPETNKSGSPEDGGQHSRYVPRLGDGLSRDQIAPEEFCYYRPATADTYIVDRNNWPLDLWEHLPRLDNELNHYEYTTIIPKEYQSLYIVDGNDKWTLKPIFQERWGKDSG